MENTIFYLSEHVLKKELSYLEMSFFKCLLYHFAEILAVVRKGFFQFMHMIIIKLSNVVYDTEFLFTQYQVR